MKILLYNYKNKVLQNKAYLISQLLSIVAIAIYVFCVFYFKTLIDTITILIDLKFILMSIATLIILIKLFDSNKSFVYEKKKRKVLGIKTLHLIIYFIATNLILVLLFWTPLLIIEWNNITNQWILIDYLFFILISSFIAKYNIVSNLTSWLTIILLLFLELQIKPQVYYLISILLIVIQIIVLKRFKTFQKRKKEVRSKKVATYLPQTLLSESILIFWREKKLAQWLGIYVISCIYMIVVPLDYQINLQKWLENAFNDKMNLPLGFKFTGASLVFIVTGLILTYKLQFISFHKNNYKKLLNKQNNQHVYLNMIILNIFITISTLFAFIPSLNQIKYNPQFVFEMALVQLFILAYLCIVTQRTFIVDFMVFVSVDLLQVQHYIIKYIYLPYSELVLILIVLIYLFKFNKILDYIQTKRRNNEKKIKK